MRGQGVRGREGGIASRVGDVGPKDFGDGFEWRDKEDMVVLC